MIRGDARVGAVSNNIHTERKKGGQELSFKVYIYFSGFHIKVQPSIILVEN